MVFFCSEKKTFHRDKLNGMLFQDLLLESSNVYMPMYLLYIYQLMFFRDNIIA